MKNERQTIKSTEDGFLIAERDLELRGQGDVLLGRRLAVAQRAGLARPRAPRA